MMGVIDCALTFNKSSRTARVSYEWALNKCAAAKLASIASDIATAQRETSNRNAIARELTDDNGDSSRSCVLLHS